MDERSSEFELLRHTQLKDASENEALKERLKALKDANEREKKELESQMSQIIHSQAGQLAKQNEKISTLQQTTQEELVSAQAKMGDQEREIIWLKKALEESNQAKQSPIDQMERMQKVLEAWQSQATSSQQEVDSSIVQIQELRQHISSLELQLQTTHDQYKHAQSQWDDTRAQLSSLEQTHRVHVTLLNER